jgi:quinohemoprotein ethanol dehydrogenase
LAESAAARAAAATAQAVATEEWPNTGNDAAERRFSPLDQINDTSISRLGLAWSYKVDMPRGLEATPIVVGGTMYVSTTYDLVYALDARNGAELWRYDPHVDRALSNRGCCDAVNRGVAVAGGRVYVAAFDGRLIALDAKSGKPAWIVDTITDHTRNLTITGAPRIIGDKVIIGNGGGEYGVRGYVTAYDLDTGRQAWRFYTVPGDPKLPPEDDAMALASRTWQGTDYAAYGGGGNVWDSISYDAQRKLVYIGVGNGSVWSRKLRSDGAGDNLFLASIVALNAETGKYVWHYQETPGDEWDQDASADMILATLPIAGRKRDVIMQASKNGFFYVLDRGTGKLICARNFVPVNWAKAIDQVTGRPIDDVAARYEDGHLHLVTPSSVGAHNWPPMSYNPQTGLVYIPAMINAWYFQAVPRSARPDKLGVLDFGVAFWPADPTKIDGTAAPSAADIPDLSKPEILASLRKTWVGKLIAWDPVAQHEVWSVKHKTMYNGGTLSTAGNVVFQGSGDGVFAAFRATDGKPLWQWPANTGVLAGPISYTIGGEQYVAVAAGWGGGMISGTGAIAAGAGVRSNPFILAYKLGGTAPPPPATPAWPAPAVLPTHATQAQLQDGKLLYLMNCAVCHGGEVISGGAYPDLRHMSLATYNAFGFVLGGALSSAGMPSFKDRLTADQIEAIRQYIGARNQDLRNATHAP